MKKHLSLLLLIPFLFSSCQQAMPTPELEEPVAQEITTTLAPTYERQTESFYTYEGQGHITLTSTLPVDVDLYINHHICGTHTLSTEALQLNIQDFTIDGNNEINLIYEDTFTGNIQLNHTSPTVSNTYTGADFTEEELKQLDNYINEEINNGFPGSVLLIMKKGEIVKNTAYGNALEYDGMETLDTPQPMTSETLFDLASITKTYATTFAIMKLEDEGLIRTSDYVHQYLDGFDTEDKSSITINHLLTHTSGFNASYRFFDPDNYYGEDYYSLDRNRTISLLSTLPLKYPTGTDSIYSDLGFITLGAIIEKITGMTLDAYVEDSIYSDLNLTHTLYTPLEKSISQNMIAATERAGNTRDNLYEWPEVRSYTLQGEVHDELAYYTMNGISGNAGLFSNTYELAVMSQMLLNGGHYGDQQIFEPETVEKFTTQSSTNERYCLGFDYGGHERNYRRYSMLSSEYSYGKTGWTGTDILIDPAHDLVVILLTNKRHTPYEKGSFLGSDYQTGKYAPIMTQVYEMLLDTSSYDYGFESNNHATTNTTSDIVLGIDRVNEYSHYFDNKNIGLITNNSGKSSDGKSSIDSLYENTNLVSLFSPEHGIDGLLEAGERYGSTTDALTNLPVYSLYGNTLKPTPKMLKDIDVMAFDIQDVGVRYYTYIYTMLNAMEACAENDVEFVVFDRPNPLGGTIIEGNLVEDDYTSFVGMYPLPIRHGLTAGELAMYINDTYDMACDLTVIPMKNWNRSMYYDDTTLEFIAPSPNMRTATTAMVYPSTCLMEGTNISEARGTDYPFEMVGAPFVNPYTLAEELNSYDLEGVTFTPTSFMPLASKYEHQLCYGVRITIENKATFKSVDMGISLLYAFKNLYEDEFETKEWLNYLAGTDLVALLEDDELTRDDVIPLFNAPSEFVERSLLFHLYD